MNSLGDAVRWVEKHHPLPRCPHGSALRDHGYELLEPPCGCRASPAMAEYATKQRAAITLGLRLRAKEPA